MGTAFLLDLAYAAGIAISPTPVVVVILMLFSPSGRRNAIAYLIGWIIGLVLLGVILLALFNTGSEFLESSSFFSRPLIQILLGIGILVMGWRRWNKSPKATPEEAMPKWFASVDDMLTKSSDKFTPRRALVLALVMSALSPKNIALMLALFLSISQAGLDARDAFILIFVFILLSSVTIGIPILYAIVKGEDAHAALNEWKTWVILNRGRAIALLLFLLGGIVILNGVISLLEQSTFT